jgi:hypothetical protein
MDGMLHREILSRNFLLHFQWQMPIAGPHAKTRPGWARCQMNLAKKSAED